MTELKKRQNLEAYALESRKAYVKRWREQNPYHLYDIGEEWRHAYIKVEDIDKFYLFAKEVDLKLGEECEDEDLIGYCCKDGICNMTFHCDGQTAIAVYDALRKAGIQFQVDLYFNNKVYK